MCMHECMVHGAVWWWWICSRGLERQWEGGSVNSPPCIKNWHAGAALCVAWPHQASRHSHFLTAREAVEASVDCFFSLSRSTLTSKALAFVTPQAPLAASQCQNNTSSSAEGLGCSACLLWNHAALIWVSKSLLAVKISDQNKVSARFDFCLSPH